MDFTIKIQEELIRALVNSGYDFITVNESLQTDKSRFIILRHDVEARYDNALEFAKIQHKYGIRGTYYFRILKNHYNPEVVKEITSLGHEAGYHYDDLTKCKGDLEKAIKRFESNLNQLNDITPIKTICMDGSPISKYDNKALWKKYNYKDYGIESEPYFDVDFTDILYLTDTGRMWDGEKFSVRDRVGSEFTYAKASVNIKGKSEKGEGVKERRGEKHTYHSTSDIIKALELGSFPDKAMFTFHPQRWNNKPLPWIQEFVMQNVKNQVKRVLVK